MLTERAAYSEECRQGVWKQRFFWNAWRTASRSNPPNPVRIRTIASPRHEPPFTQGHASPPRPVSRGGDQCGKRWSRPV